MDNLLKQEIDWNSIKFRASSWGNLLSEPKEKAAKDRGDLSLTCQKELIKIYNQEVYGRKKDIVTKQITKGLICEEDGIDLYSRVEKKLYIKNEERLENEWFTGHPDIFTGTDIRSAEEVDDIKISWELDSFMPKLIEEPDKDYVAQLNVYFNLTGAKVGAVVYTLVSAPFNVLEAEKRRLLYSMNVVSEESIQYRDAAKEMERNMIFEDIDYRERVIKHKVYRDDVLIQKMKDKVPSLRTWLFDFHKKHMNQYPKPLTLV